jgi:anti-sigma-K factor RskA
MITCEHCREELAEYALGHSDKGVAAAVAEHLAACVVCRRELAETEAAWAALACDLPQEQLRPAVLEQLLDRIEQADGPRPPVATAAKAPPLSRRQRLLSYVLAASVLAALIGGSMYLRPSADVSLTGNATADQALRDLASRLGKLQELEQMLNTGNVKVASLRATAQRDAPTAYVVWDLPTRQWHFHALALPTPPAGKAYQLWAATEGAAPLAGPTFAVDSRGVGSVVADFPALKPGAIVRAIVTLEPAGGSPAPTGDVVLDAPL